MTKIGDAVHVTHEHRDGTVTEVTYVEDGRKCQVVEVQELLVGDEILGWYGEEWTWGTVTDLERVPQPSYAGGGTEPRVAWFIVTDGERRSQPIHDAKSLRRITARKGVHVPDSVTQENWERATLDAGLGVGHIWTAIECPAYTTLDPNDCTCQEG